MYKFLVFPILLILLFPFVLHAQVVNAEELRINEKDQDWIGDVGLSFGLGRNNAGQINIDVHPHKWIES